MAVIKVDAMTFNVTRWDRVPFPVMSQGAPVNIPLVVSSVATFGALGWCCASLRGWSRRNKWLGLLLGLHLGPIGWLAILVAPRRRV